MSLSISTLLSSQPVRYIINGLVATGVNFCAMAIFVYMLGDGKAWLASALACVIGITTSFIGSKYFVFPGAQDKTYVQATKFVLVYGLTACLYALVLYLWTDLMGWDWKIGFVLATGLQVAVSYSANKFLVFNK